MTELEAQAKEHDEMQPSQPPPPTGPKLVGLRPPRFQPRAQCGLQPSPPQTPKPAARGSGRRPAPRAWRTAARAELYGRDDLEAPICPAEPLSVPMAPVSQSKVCASASPSAGRGAVGDRADAAEVTSVWLSKFSAMVVDLGGDPGFRVPDLARDLAPSPPASSHSRHTTARANGSTLPALPSVSEKAIAHSRHMADGVSQRRISGRRATAGRPDRGLA